MDLSQLLDPVSVGAARRGMAMPRARATPVPAIPSTPIPSARQPMPHATGADPNALTLDQVFAAFPEMPETERHALQAMYPNLQAPDPLPVPTVDTAPQGFMERLATRSGTAPFGQGRGLIGGFISGLGNSLAQRGAQTYLARVGQQQRAAAIIDAENKRQLDLYDKGVADVRKHISESAASLRSARSMTHVLDPSQAAPLLPFLPPDQQARVGTTGLTDPEYASAVAEWRKGTTGGGNDFDFDKLTPDALDKLSVFFIAHGGMPTNTRLVGKGSQQALVKIMNRAAEIAPQLDWNVAGADYKAQAASLANMRKQYDNVQAYSQTVDANSKILEGALAGIPETGTTVTNWLARNGAKALGDTGMASFNTARLTVNNEFARILTSGPTLGGELSDHARKEMQAVLDGNYTKAQLRNSLAILKQDAENRKQAYANQMRSISLSILYGVIKKSPPAPYGGAQDGTDVPPPYPTGGRKSIFDGVKK